MNPYPAYRPSGVEWLGEVPEHWEVRPLKALLSKNDSGVWGDDPEEEDVRSTIVLRSTEQTVDGGWAIEAPATRMLSPRERAGALLKVGDLVVTKSSGSEFHIGKTSLVTVEVSDLNACFSNFMQRLRCRSGFDPRLVWYLLNSPVGRQQLVFNSNTTTGLANLNGTIFGEVVTPVPPVDEQRAIAAFLDRETERIDALVAKMRLLIERLQEHRTALITRAVTRGLPSDAARAVGLDPSPRLKPSGVEWLGEVPEHWEVRPLKALLSKNDSGVWGDDPEEEDVRSTIVLRSTEQTVDGGWAIEAPATRMLSPRERAGALLKVGDLVVTKSSGSEFHIGKTSLVTVEVSRPQRVLLELHAASPLPVWVRSEARVVSPELAGRSPAIGLQFQHHHGPSEFERHDLRGSGDPSSPCR